MVRTVKDFIRENGNELEIAVILLMSKPRRIMKASESTPPQQPLAMLVPGKRDMEKLGFNLSDEQKTPQAIFSLLHVAHEEMLSNIMGEYLHLLMRQELELRERLKGGENESKH